MYISNEEVFVTFLLHVYMQSSECMTLLSNFGPSICQTICQNCSYCHRIAKHNEEISSAANQHWFYIDKLCSAISTGQLLMGSVNVACRFNKEIGRICKLNQHSRHT